VPYGSIDFAIGRIHGDKTALLNYVQDGDTSSFGNDDDSQWKKCMRIVDEALVLVVHEDARYANFPPMPSWDSEDLRTRRRFTVLSNVITRGNEPRPESPAPQSSAAAAVSAVAQTVHHHPSWRASMAATSAPLRAAQASRRALEIISID
jgi:hypothetical protein